MDINSLINFWRCPRREKIWTLQSVYYWWRTSFLYRPICPKMGNYVVIFKPIKISPECLFLGSRVTILHHGRIEGVTKYYGQTFNPRIILDDDVTIQQNLHLTCASQIHIGRNTAIAANVSITDINHRYDDISIPPEKQPLNVSKVTVGENCKIYNNSVILPGTKLGKHTIVGANAVVSGQFPDYCVIGGIPAKILKLYNKDNCTWESIGKDQMKSYERISK